jgi:RNA polymerase sigma factor (sigma-70 family)
VTAEGEDMATGLRDVLEHLHRPGGGLTDGQLLARFVSTRDETAFAALVRRHGPLVLGVCGRVLGNRHDAEDAFQATFLVLARKAASVAKRESVGCWLHGVARHTALRAAAARARRRRVEKQVGHMPHPQAAPPEENDWLPLLDRELGLLPGKYRDAIVLCDLEGRPRREAARLLRLPEGTLSSRLATGRKMLAKRLARCGLALSGGAVAAAMSPGAASAGVPGALVGSTARAAALVAAGQLAASAPAALLMKEVMKAMLVQKLRLVAGALVVLVAAAIGGLAYHAAGLTGTLQAAPPEKPRSEMEALRRENELLKLNLEVVLEKVRAQENELRALRPRPTGSGMGLSSSSGGLSGLGSSSTASTGGLSSSSVFGNKAGPLTGSSSSSSGGLGSSSSGSTSSGGLLGPAQGGNPGTLRGTSNAPQRPDPVKEVEAALKQLREARDKDGQRRAAEALEQATARLREQLK